jgi:cytochrome c553
MTVHFTITRLRALIVAAAVVAAVLGASFTGLVPIAASSGHLAPIGWFLHWTMRNAVRTQSLAVENPSGLALTDRGLIRRGAGHFATGCAPCHGAPGLLQSPVVLSMTPPPPRLEDRVGDWRDRELFWVVRHGVKYTGMPAWPTQKRDDEVWAEVAFLRALPEMSAETYARLALGGEEPDGAVGNDELPAADAVLESALAECARCHGRAGLGQGPRGAFPVIAGQSADYLFATLKAFAKGERKSGFMQPPARRYGTETLRRLADHFSSRPAGEALGALSGDGLVAAEDLLEEGRRIATEGVPSRKIPACESCHGHAGRARNPHYPWITGQPRWYLSTHLRLWREEKRGGTAYAHVMAETVDGITEEQIEAVSAWYASQPLPASPVSAAEQR